MDINSVLINNSRLGGYLYYKIIKEGALQQEVDYKYYECDEINEHSTNYEQGESNEIM